MDTLWGVYSMSHASEAHVAPCDERGKVLRPHLLRHDCPCCPKFEFPVQPAEHDALVIHNELTIH